MRDLDPQAESAFFALFRDFFDSEKDAGRQHDPANYTLDRMAPLADLAGHPERHLNVVHVAGTKGKGSTCHFTAALMAAAGCRAGLFTSPHLDTVRERFQLDGRLAGYDELTAAAQPLLDGVRRAGLRPSLFELFTVLALRLFADAGMDYAVLETGIGGRVDSTNYVPAPLCTAITPVSYDHMALLGQTIREIASEKAGIIKDGVPLVLAPQPYPEAAAVIRETAARRHAPVILPDAEDIAPYAPAFPPRVPAFLLDNLRVALAIVRSLGLRPDPSRFRWPLLRARCEVIRQAPLTIIDGAHNGDSMEKLVDALNALYPDIRFTVILGVVAGKDVRRIVSALRRLDGARFLLTNPHTGKGSALPELAREAASAGLPVCGIVPELDSADKLPAGPLLFTGSFFTALIAEELIAH